MYILLILLYKQKWLMWLLWFAKTLFAWYDKTWVHDWMWHIVVQLLLDEGAEAHMTNVFGRTALYFAANKGHQVVVQLLLNWGAQINMADQFGVTQLHPDKEFWVRRVEEAMLQGV